MAEKGDKQHHIAGITGANVGGHLHHQRGQQAHPLGKAGAQHQGEDRPSGANPLKFLITFGRNQCNPSTLSRFLTTTRDPSAGFWTPTLKAESIAVAAISATIR